MTRLQYCYNRLDSFVILLHHSISQQERLSAMMSLWNPGRCLIFHWQFKDPKPCGACRDLCTDSWMARIAPRRSEVSEACDADANTRPQTSIRQASGKGSAICIHCWFIRLRLSLELYRAWVSSSPRPIRPHKRGQAWRDVCLNIQGLHLSPKAIRGQAS